MTKNLTIIPRYLEGVPTPQRQRDGYINATGMCKAAGRLWGHYWANSSTKAFIEELSRSIGIPIDLLTHSITTGKNELRGTWVHPYIAVHLAQWCSAKFAVAVSQWVYEWMTKPHRHIGIRQAGIDVRKDFTATLLAHGVMGKGYPQVTNSTYLGLHGLDAKGLREKHKLPTKANIREHMSSEGLAFIMAAEQLAGEQIRETNLLGNDPCARAAFDSAQHMRKAILDYRKTYKKLIGGPS